VGSCSPEQPQSALCDDAVRLLASGRLLALAVAALQRHAADPQLQSAGCRLLAAAADGAPDARAAALRAGALAPVVAALAHAGSGEAAPRVHALAALLRKPTLPTQQSARSAGALRALVAALHACGASDATLALHACSAADDLLSLTGATPVSVLPADAADAANTLLAALGAHAASSPRLASHALRAVACLFPSGHALLPRGAIAAAAVAAMCAHPSDVDVAAASTCLLGNACRPGGADAGCDAAATARALVAAMRAFPSCDAVQDYSLCALQWLTRHPRGAEACVAAGALPVVHSALRAHHEGWTRDCAHLLTALVTAANEAGVSVCTQMQALMLTASLLQAAAAMG
jgi:hypothetical protein